MKIKTYAQFKKEKKPIGVYKDIPNEEYHKHYALGRSDLEQIAVSPKHFKYYKENPKDPTPAMIKGTALHSMFLQPELDEVASAPDVERRTKKGKEEWAKFLEESEGKIVLSHKDHEAVRQMVESCFLDTEIFSTYEQCVEELTVFAEIGGILCKARPDAWDLKNNILYDLKSCASAKEEAFCNAIYDKGYHRQAAFYFKIIEESKVATRPQAFKFWCVENTPPYVTNTLTLSQEFIDLGDEDLLISFKKYLKAVHNNEYLGYDGGYKEVVPKAWMFYKNQETN